MAAGIQAHAGGAPVLTAKRFAHCTISAGAAAYESAAVRGAISLKNGRRAHDKNIRMLDFPPFFLASYRCTYILLP